MDRAKSALFNILHNLVDFETIEVVDLFSGTGGISFEFASRGVKKLTCIEQNRKYAAEINRNAEILGISGLSVLCIDALRYISRAQKRFDLAFADPPYQLENIETLNGRLLEGIVKEGGLLIIEHATGITFLPPQPYDTRTYGGSSFSFFRR